MDGKQPTVAGVDQDIVRKHGGRKDVDQPCQGHDRPDEATRLAVEIVLSGLARDEPRIQAVEGECQRHEAQKDDVRATGLRCLRVVC